MENGNFSNFLLRNYDFAFINLLKNGTVLVIAYDQDT